jgi:hypothetical protein
LRFEGAFPDLYNGVMDGSLTLAQATTELERRLTDAVLKRGDMDREDFDAFMLGDAIGTLREAIDDVAERGLRRDRQEVSYRKALRALRYVTSDGGDQ